MPTRLKIESWLGSFTILEGSGPVLLKNYIFVIFEGGGPDPLSPSRSAYALHPTMSKNRANVLLVFQCSGICLTPSQVDILVSDDSLAFCPTMYNRVFNCVETRAKLELRVRLVPLNMLKVSRFFFFTCADFVDCRFKCYNVTNLAFTPYSVCVCV